MNKAYSRVFWRNAPSFDTPLNQQNLNRMDKAIDDIDDRVVEFSVTKLDTVTGNTLLKTFDLDLNTGIITVERLDGTLYRYDTAIEKIAINFDFDETTNELVLTLEDGTEKRVDLTRLIDVYIFDDTDTIAVREVADHQYEFSVKLGSIKNEHLENDYLAEIVANSELAATSAVDARESADEIAKLLEDEIPAVMIDWDTGELLYSGGSLVLYVDNEGILHWGRD